MAEGGGAKENKARMGGKELNVETVEEDIDNAASSIKGSLLQLGLLENRPGARGREPFWVTAEAYAELRRRGPNKRTPYPLNQDFSLSMWGDNGVRIMVTSRHPNSDGTRRYYSVGLIPSLIMDGKKIDSPRYEHEEGKMDGYGNKRPSRKFEYHGRYHDATFAEKGGAPRLATNDDWLVGLEEGEQHFLRTTTDYFRRATEAPRSSLEVATRRIATAAKAGSKMLRRG